MQRDLPYPQSFPDQAEERFIRLILCPDSEFPGNWEAWKRDVVFDDIDFATLRLLPLLHLRLAALGIADDLITGRIRGVYKLTWLKNQRLIESVRQIAASCEREGIPLLLLKGLALLLDIYGNPGARTTGDGDLLVHPEHVLRVTELLQQQGWRLDDAAQAPAGEFMRFAPELYHAMPFRNQQGIAIDLHWRVFAGELNANPAATLGLLCLRVPRHPPETNPRHWGNSVETRLKGQAVRSLSPEDLLVHVMVHGARWNPYRPLRWVVDAVHIIRARQLDWERVMAATVAGEHEVDVGIAFRYLRSRNGVELPESFSRWLDGLAPTRAAIARYQRKANRVPPLWGHFPVHWYRYWKHESRGSALQRCREFPAYLRKVWKIAEDRSLLRFALDRLGMRVREIRRARRFA